jgi:hypothetical protein
MSPKTKKLLERVDSWPQEDQDELAEFARAIEARRSGAYVVDDEEEAAIREGLTQLDRGEWVSEEAMRSFWRRFLRPSSKPEDIRGLRRKRTYPACAARSCAEILNVNESNQPDMIRYYGHPGVRDSGVRDPGFPLARE